MAKTTTVFQTFPDKKKSPYGANILRAHSAHYLVRFENDFGDTVERIVNRGACSASIKPKKT